MSHRRHFPVQNTNNTRLRLVENHIVDLVVAVDKGSSVFGLQLRVREELDHLIIVRDLAHGDVGLLIASCRLRVLDSGEGLELAVVEAGRLAEGFEAYACGLDAVEFGEGFDGALPPVASIISRL